MNKKENKGGFLKNEQVEQDLKVQNKNEGSYNGSQDTGDKTIRQFGNDTQQRDGFAEEQNEEE
jgi:hypothetical protein